MSWRGHLLLLFVISAAVCAVARADEIRLKDGSKIVGTIVGFEDGAFKVETVYGFAMVRKANILEIIPAETPKPAEPKPPAKSAEPAAPKSAGKPAATAQPAPAAQPSSATDSNTHTPGTAPPATSGVSANATQVHHPAALVSPEPPPAVVPVAAPVAAPIPAPEPAPKPVPVQETVIGNLYTNMTYGFSMYKPPNWEILADRSGMLEAITALGTSDHSTLLVIGRDTVKGTPAPGLLDARAAATEHKLRDVYENYRPLPLQHPSIADLPAAQQRFRGSADGHDWSVIAVTLIRGNEVFTILGMTYADSDLIQLQENVIGKAVSSLQFSPAH